MTAIDSSTKLYALLGLLTMRYLVAADKSIYDSAFIFNSFHTEMAAKSMEHFDHNRDGTISQDEYKTMSAYKQDLFKELNFPAFTELDTNKDGQLDKSELSAFLSEESGEVDLDLIKTKETPGLRSQVKLMLSRYRKRICRDENDSKELDKVSVSSINLKCDKSLKLYRNLTEDEVKEHNRLTAAIVAESIGTLLLMPLLFYFTIMFFGFLTHPLFWLLIAPITIGIWIGQVFLLKQLIKDARKLDKLNRS
jgi:hypothetical protein